LEVVDIYQSPLLATEADILATPTLVKQLPLPARRLIGDLSERGRVLLLLDLKEKGKADGKSSANPKRAH
jgi:circadian clock protein KaiB